MSFYNRPRDEWPQGLGSIEAYTHFGADFLQLRTHFGSDVLQLRKACSARGINWSLSHSWRELQVRLALSDAIESARAANTFGSKWRNVGSMKPERGSELKNDGLAAALRAVDAEFTEKECHTLGIDGLRLDHYVKAGDDYFEPVAPLIEALGVAPCLVRASWLQGQDSFGGKITGEQKGLLEVDQIRDIHSRFGGANVLPVVTLMELWPLDASEGASATSATTPIPASTRTATAATYFGRETLPLFIDALNDLQSDDDDDDEAMRRERLPDICVALPWSTIATSDSESLPEPTPSVNAPSSEKPKEKPKETALPPLPTTLKELRLLCSECQIDWSLTDDADKLSELLQVPESRKKRLRHADKDRATAAAMAAQASCSLGTRGGVRLLCSELQMGWSISDDTQKLAEVLQAPRSRTQRLQDADEDRAAMEAAMWAELKATEEIKAKRLAAELEQDQLRAADAIKQQEREAGFAAAKVRADENRRAYAAKRVQTSYRGHYVRRHKRPPPGLPERPPPGLPSQHEAAKRVQSSYRGHHVRRHKRSPPGLPSQHEAARRVQSSYRGHCVRRDRLLPPSVEAGRTNARPRPARPPPGLPGLRVDLPPDLLPDLPPGLGLTGLSPRAEAPPVADAPLALPPALPSPTLDWIDSEEEAEKEEEETEKEDSEAEEEEEEKEETEEAKEKDETEEAEKEAEEAEKEDSEAENDPGNTKGLYLDSAHRRSTQPRDAATQRATQDIGTRAQSTIATI